MVTSRYFSLARWSESSKSSLTPDVDADGSVQVLRDMFNDYDELRSLLETADILAKSDDWPDLYDEAQLARNEVPVYSVTYIEDMYVHYDFARETASKIRNCKTFVSNVLYHDALASKTDEIMKILFALRDDIID